MRLIREEYVYLWDFWVDLQDRSLLQNQSSSVINGMDSDDGSGQGLEADWNGELFIQLGGVII